MEGALGQESQRPGIYSSSASNSRASSPPLFKGVGGFSPVQDSGPSRTYPWLAGGFCLGWFCLT